MALADSRIAGDFLNQKCDDWCQAPWFPCQHDMVCVKNCEKRRIYLQNTAFSTGKVCSMCQPGKIKFFLQHNEKTYYTTKLFTENISEYQRHLPSLITVEYRLYPVISGKKISHFSVEEDLYWPWILERLL